MQILNIAGYQFVPLDELPSLKNQLLTHCETLSLKGTILLSNEGINLSLAGDPMHIAQFKQCLHDDSRFTSMRFHETYSDRIPFKRLKVKIKKEIITFRQPDVDVIANRANALAPDVFKQWLDENRDITVLDTRNDYEIALGTFAKATQLNLKDFTELPQALDQLDRHKPIVMFCTGGIRCEKAALYMTNQGFSDVFQLDGGILGYFSKVGGDHYEGACFVFDERIAVDTQLAPTKL